MSPDGVKWRLFRDEAPLLTDGPFDSINVVFWDTFCHGYVAEPVMSDTRIPKRGLGRTRIPPSDGSARSAGHLQRLRPLSTNSCLQHPRSRGTYLMFPSRFVQERSPTPCWHAGPMVNDIVIMSSHDGLNFDPTFM